MAKEGLSDGPPGTEIYFAFAEDDCGNVYLVNPHEDDPVVYFPDHELNGPESLKVSLSEFLAAQRRKTCR